MTSPRTAHNITQQFGHAMFKYSMLLIDNIACIQSRTRGIRLQFNNGVLIASWSVRHYKKHRKVLYLIQTVTLRRLSHAIYLSIRCLQPSSNKEQKKNNCRARYYETASNLTPRWNVQDSYFHFTAISVRFAFPTPCNCRKANPLAIFGSALAVSHIPVLIIIPHCYNSHSKDK